MKEKKVKEVMTSPGVRIGPSVHIKEIIKVFLAHHVHFLAVVDKKNNLLGVITEEDVLTPFLPEYLDFIENLDFISDFGQLEELPVEILENLLIAEDIMKKPPVIINEEDSLFKAIAIMDKKRVGYLPVVKEEKLLGVISRSDILKALFEDIL